MMLSECLLNSELSLPNQCLLQSGHLIGVLSDVFKELISLNKVKAKLLSVTLLFISYSPALFQNIIVNCCFRL